MDIVLDIPTQNKAITRHNELAKLLCNAPLSVAALSKLMCVATSNKDFRLHKQGNLMQHQNFTASLVQVTNSGCTAFVVADDQFDLLKGHVERIPEQLKCMLEEIKDQAVIKRMADALLETANDCINIVKEVVTAFTLVTDLINQVFENFVDTSGNLPDDPNLNVVEVMAALTEGKVQLGEVRDLWAKIVKFFVSVSNSIKIGMLSDTNAVKTHVVEFNSAAFQQRFVSKVIKACMASVSVLVLAETYQLVSSEHLESNIRSLLKYTADPNNNKHMFVELEKKCLALEQPILQISTDSKEGLVQKLKEGIAALKD